MPKTTLTRGTWKHTPPVERRAHMAKLSDLISIAVAAGDDGRVQGLAHVLGVVARGTVTFSRSGVTAS